MKISNASLEEQAEKYQDALTPEEVASARQLLGRFQAKNLIPPDRLVELTKFSKEETFEVASKLATGEGEFSDEQRAVLKQMLGEKPAPAAAPTCFKAKSLEEVLKVAGIRHKYLEKSECFSVTFDAAYAHNLPKTIFEKLQTHSVFKRRKDNRPLDDEWEMIQSDIGKDSQEYSKNDFKVFDVVLCGTLLDSHSEHFSLRALKQMKADAPATPAIKDHNPYQSDNVYGKLLDAKVVRIDGENFLIGRSVVRDSEKNKDIIDGIQTKMNANVSVGVTVKRDDYLCDICEKPMVKMDEDGWVWCGHMPGMTLRDGTPVTATLNGIKKFVEFSRVTVGAQPGAAFKSLVDIVTNMTKSGADFEQSIIDIAALAPAAKSDSEIPGEKEEANSVAKLHPEINEGDFAVDEVVKELLAQKELLAKQNELLTKIVEQQTAAKDGSAARTEELEAEKKLLDEKVQHLEKHAELLEKQAEIHEKKVNETREFLSIIAASHAALAKQCNVLVGKSTFEIAQQVAQAKGTETSAAQTEKDLGKDAPSFYKRILNEFIPGA